MKEKLIEVANHLMDLAHHYVETEETKQMRLPKNWQAFVEKVNNQFDWGYTPDVTPDFLCRELTKQYAYLTREYEAVNDANQFLHDQVDELREELVRTQRQPEQVMQAPEFVATLDPFHNNFAQGQGRAIGAEMREPNPQWIEDRLPNAARTPIRTGLDPFDWNPNIIQPQDLRVQTRNALDDLLFRQEQQRTDFAAQDEDVQP
jgi:hypothetical protein